MIKYYELPGVEYRFHSIYEVRNWLRNQPDKDNYKGTTLFEFYDGECIDEHIIHIGRRGGIIID